MTDRWTDGKIDSYVSTTSMGRQKTLTFASIALPYVDLELVPGSLKLTGTDIIPEMMKIGIQIIVL